MEFREPEHSGEPAGGLIQTDELRPLLERLHSPETRVEQPDDCVTVAAVAEATGCPEHQVWDMLNKIRSEDLEARLAERLREAEEPLYRVERPTTGNEPVISRSWTTRQQGFKSILDTLPKMDTTPRTKSSFRARPGEELERRFIAMFILTLFSLMLIGVCVMAAMAAMHAL